MKRLFAVSVFVFSVVCLTAGIWFTTFAGNQSNNSAGALSLERRAAYQQKIEAVYWRHRVWNNPQPKPKLEEVLPLEVIRARVEETLRKSNALETIFNRPVTPEQLRAEVERMARQTRNPEMLGELFAALDNDSFLIAEILARPALTEIFLKDLYFTDQRFQPESGKAANAESENRRDEAAFEAWWQTRKNEFGIEINVLAQSFELPAIAPAADDTWDSMVSTPAGGADSTSVWTGVEVIIWNGGNPMAGSRYNPALDMTFPVSRTNAPLNRTRHTAVWTGQEMIIWGGYNGSAPFDAFRAGWKYNPTTDAWTQTSLTNAPEARDDHVAIWTGTEMIVWGGWTPVGINLNSGGRYNPAKDTWTQTSLTNAPEARDDHVAVWTGTEMIIWGGNSSNAIFNTGGRYNPSTDSWTPTPLPALEPRRLHTAVWTGTEMIVWGGCIDFQCSISREDGSRYNPATNTWTPTAPIVGNNRSRHAAVWTGTEMIVAGGCRGGECQIRVTNIIRYNPSTNSWREARVEPIATPRQPHQAVWTGTEMLVWGVDAALFDTAVYRFNPTLNRWTRTIAANAPDARFDFSLVWTGQEMIIWGGHTDANVFNSGGRYNPAADLWTPTSLTNAPSPRWIHSAIWTGQEMIVWGGIVNNAFPFQSTNTGGRYNPSTGVWRPTTLLKVPDPRDGHTAVWTGSQMIIWGGVRDPETLHTNTGGIYNVETAQPSRTSYDYDGDSKADVSVYRSGTWYLLNSQTGFSAVNFGLTADKLVPADYDGDGKTDLAVYRSGVWYVLQSRDGFRGVQFGVTTDKPVVGDYDGDGRADFAVFRDGVWYQQRSQTGFSAVQFGATGDVPVPADYDGDGKTDVAVFRSGTWYLLQTTAGFAGVQFGISTDIPLPSARVP